MAASDSQTSGRQIGIGVSDEFESLVEAVNLTPEQRADLGVTTDEDTIEDAVFGDLDAAVLTANMREALGGI
jgi:hypothetical protein